MKPRLIFGCFLLLISTGLAQSTIPDSVSVNDRAKLNSISDHVDSGDYNALYEAAEMPASVAVPYLEFWTGLGRTPQQHEAAVEALRNVQGYADYLRSDMSGITASGYIPSKDFEILELIGTEPAAAVVAPYLFDFNTIVAPSGDLAGDSNLAEALYTLNRMKLSYAPSPVPIGLHSDSEELIAWQKWAIAKGFVPKEWTSRVGAPAWLLGMEAWKPPTPTPQPIRTASSPLPATASSPVPTNTPPPATTPSTVETRAPWHVSSTLIAVVLVGLIIGGIFAWKKRC